MADLNLRPVRVKTGTLDTEGILVFDGDELVAVLVRLSDTDHGDDCGSWSVEAIFTNAPTYSPLFGSLDRATGWLQANMM